MIGKKGILNKVLVVMLVVFLSLAYLVLGFGLPGGGFSSPASQLPAKTVVVGSSEGIEITGCGFTGWQVGKKHILKKKLKTTESNGVCLEPDKDNIIIDCDTNKIEGSGETKNYKYGIRIKGLSNVNITNCQIEKFGSGVTIEDKGSKQSKNILLKGNVIINNIRVGVFFDKDNEVKLISNRIEKNPSFDLGCYSKKVVGKSNQIGTFSSTCSIIENCEDYIDNDKDGKIDCRDSDCKADSACVSPPSSPIDICTSGLTKCIKKCVNLKTDINNCGFCDNACDPGEECAQGKCKIKYVFSPCTLKDLSGCDKTNTCNNLGGTV